MFIVDEYKPKPKGKRKSAPKNTVDCCMKCGSKNRCELRCSWAFESKCLNKCKEGGCPVRAREMDSSQEVLKFNY